MADVNPLDAVVAELKAKVTGAEKERDDARTETATVKKQGEKLLDENATLSRSWDDAKKTIADLAKGVAGGGGGEAGSGGTPPAGDDKPKETVGAMLSRWCDNIYYFPQKPPQKPTE